jgi:maltose alpha-D-glucosyltransferase/alpha-amylase
MRLLVDRYRDCPELAWGRYTMLDPGREARPVLAHRSGTDGTTVVALHNFADAEVEAVPVLQGLAGAELTDVLDPRADPVRVGDDGTISVTLPPYGYRWLRCAPERVARS